MANHRYWRLQINAAASGSIVGVRSLELRATVGGANMSATGNGTPSASTSNGSYPPSQAFDASGSTDWISTAGMPQWLQWDFGAGNERDVAQVVIVNPYANGYGLLHGNIQYSDDGTIFTIWGFIGSPNTAAGVTNTYLQVPPGSGAVNVVTQQYTAQGRFGGSGAALLPQQSVVARSGGAGISVTPALFARGASGANGVATLAALTASGSWHNSSNERSASITLGNISVGGYSGANAKASIALSVSASGTATNSAALDSRIPGLYVTAIGTAASIANAELRTSTYKAIGYVGSVLAVSISGKFASSATATVGGIGVAVAELPLFVVTGKGARQSSGAVIGSIPALHSSAGAVGYLILPGFTLTAIGSALVSVSYEAYALNLKHSDPESQDELTRYTNYPFDRIVRYKNSYFGMNNTGLYLLEGTTDFATPTPTEVPWSYKTALMDMKSVQLKNVSMAYFGGRMGPAATVSVYVGEASVAPYNYTTPRDATAQNYRQPLGKGLKSRYYAFGASGTGELTLDTLSLDVAVLARKV